MKVTTWLLRILSNEDNSTDLIEYVLIASLLAFGVFATCAPLVSRISVEFGSIASHL